jgi:hypothetical protein
VEGITCRICITIPRHPTESRNMLSGVLATVGLGDLHPETTRGKALIVVFGWISTGLWRTSPRIPSLLLFPTLNSVPRKPRFFLRCIYASVDCLEVVYIGRLGAIIEKTFIRHRTMAFALLFLICSVHLPLLTLLINSHSFSSWRLDMGFGR